MAERHVIKERARLFPHEGADRLELCKVGAFQLVVRKGEFQDGDPIVIAPERAVLPPQLAKRYVNSETGASYLHGPEHNRVGPVRLRGELSQGVILPGEGLEDLPFGEDLSEHLGITFWEPPIPLHMAGEVAPLPVVRHYTHHDVEQFGIYAGEFREGEPVLAHEKLHGSQGVYYRTAAGEWLVTSKGLSRNRLTLRENAGNVYWQAARNVGLFGAADAAFPSGEVQVFGEVVPVQKGFTYGQRHPTVFVFKLIHEGRVLARPDWPTWFVEHAVPRLYEGPFDVATLRGLRNGLETVSGQGLHIREGIVVTPLVPRLTADGRDLSLKLISDAYAKKETGGGRANLSKTADRRLREEGDRGGVQLMPLLNVIDVEATCWEGEPPPGQQNEIIEIGVCVLDLGTLERVEKRSLLVRPEHSEVSAFCTQLTGLTAAEVASGLSFREACEVLRRDFDSASRPWASWGDYDRRQFERQCGEEVPSPFCPGHTNAKGVYAAGYGLKRAGMARALRHAGLPLEGTHHRGADDAWNIAALIARMVRDGVWQRAALQALVDLDQELGLL